MREGVPYLALGLLSAVLASDVALADPPAASPISDTKPKPENADIPLDQFGRPLACDRFLPPGAWRPAGDSGTLISVRVTADGNLHDAALYRSSGDGGLDQAALACAPTRHLHVTENGKPIEVVWIVGVYWHASWSVFKIPSRNDTDENQCSAGAFWEVGRGTRGTVKLSYSIGLDGRVRDVSIDQSTGNDALDRKAVECISQILYFPAEQNGHAVVVDRHAELTWGKR